MRPREERELAARLARVLDGAEAAEGEAGELATLLQRAAAPARIEVPDAEVEGALARTRRRGTAPRRLPLRAASLAGAAGIAIVASAAALLTRGGGLAIEGKALAALGGPTSALRVVERIDPGRPGTFPPSVRVGWLDPARGRAIWNQYVRGRLVAVTLLERGRVTRYSLRANTAIVGPSCRAFASGCAELVDPVELYRRALQSAGADAVETTAGGRRVYRLRLPVQELADAVRIEQVVTIDAATYLPRRIEWREQGAGGERAFAVITIRRVKVVPASLAASATQLALPANVRVEQRVAPAQGVRELGRRRVPLEDARRLRPPLQWLGRRYRGGAAAAIEEIRWNAGRAYRVRYGELTVWNYGALVPPELVAARYVPAKTLPFRNGVARFFSTDEGRLVLEFETAGRSVALVAPQYGKQDLFTVLEDLRPLR